VTCRLTRAGSATDETPEEIEQNLSVALNPLQQLRVAAVHFRFSRRVSPVKQAGSQFMGRLWGGQAS
jgi:hypothetical protein